MLVDMVSSTRLHYAIQFVDNNGNYWFDSNLFPNKESAIEHAKRMSDVPGFCVDFSVQSISYWLNQL